MRSGVCNKSLIVKINMNAIICNEIIKSCEND